MPYRISYIDTSMSADDQQMDGRLRSEEFATEPAALTRARPFGRAGMRSCAGWGQKCPADEIHILTVSTACRISETKIVCQQIRYSLRSPKRAARSSIPPSLSRNQFTSELSHRMWSKNGKLKSEIP